ncbi:hypothetical protein SARC_09594 [Sphaeroforma arctica JP610]|uniref:Uncharacterized protein n=1 Tax=Sphaeroforma arctica JP610 TaxID=667725 RepID=A0A0L0FPQ7_9EUKA|nr:hypothetical protein SARC_09594 [Sphaeroforma arctica JP610]KNC77958.1 hypothetical protein SARC_09594 [Sphaeroforma arctica JP610]|eukprot:XP_014151860.1 hypothetical protein SARC_09594 [Sphaeroforma arctica JP610]
MQSSMPSPLKKPLSPEADENLLKTYLKNKDENAGVMEASVPESNQVIDLASSDDEAAAAPDTAALPTSVKSGPVAIRSNGTELSVLNSDGKSLTKSGDAGTNMAISDESQPLTSISNDSGTNSGTKSGTSSGPKIIGTGIAARARRNHENQIGADKSTVDMSQSVKAMPTVLIGSLENYQRISAEAIKPSSTSTVLTEYAYKKQNNTSDTAASPTDLAPESDPKPPTPLKIDTLKEAKIMTPSSSQANVYIAGDSLLRTDDMSPPPPVLLGTRAQSSDVVDVPDESPYSDSNIPPEGSVVEHARMPTNEHVDVESDTTELTHTDTAGYKPDEEPSRLSDGVGEHINVDTSESAEDEDSGEGNGGDHSNPEIMDRALPRALPDHMREDKDSFVTNVSTHDLTDAVSKDVDPASVNHVDVVSSTSMLGRGASGKNRNEAISSDNTKDRGWYETQQQALHTTANAIHTAEKSFSEMDIVSQTTDGKKKVVIGVGSAPPKKSTNTAEVPARSRVLGNMINTETGKESAESMTGRDPMPGKDDNTLGESRPGVEKQSVDVGVSRKVYELDDTGVAHKGVVTGTHGPMEGKGSVPEDEDMRMSGSAMEEKMKDIYSGVSGTKDLDGTGLTGVLTNSTSVQYKHSLQPDTKYDTSHTQRKGKLEQPITSSMVVGSTDRPDVVVKTTTTPKLEKQSMSGATAPGLTNQAAPEKKKKVVIGQGESRYATQGPYRPTESSKARPYTQTHIQTPNKPRLLHPVAHASAPTTTPASTTSTKGGVTAKLNNLSLDRAPKSSPYATLGRANLEPGTIRKLQELSCKGGRKAKFFIPTVKGSVPTSVIKITPQSTATSQPVPSAQPDRKLHEQHSEKAKPAQLKRPSLDRTQSNISTNAKPIKRKHSSSDYMQSSLSTLTTDSNPFRSEKVLNAPRLISDIHASKPKAQGAGINSTQIASPRAHSRKDGRFSRSLSPIAATKSGSGEVPYEQSITISDDEPRGGVSRAKIKTRVVTIDSDNEVAEDSGSRAQSKSPVNSRSKAVSHGPIAGRLGELEWESESNDEDKPKKDRGRGKKQIMLGLERTNILAESMKRHGLNKSAANTPRPGSRQTDRSDREKGGKSRHKKEKCKGQRNTMDNYGVSGNSVKKSQRRHQDIVELDDKDDLTEFMVNRPDLAFLADHKSDEHTDMKPDTHPTLGDKKHIQTHTDKHKTSSKSARAQYTIEDMRAPRSGPISNVPGHSNRQSISPARRSRRRSTTSSSVEHESPGLHKHTDARTQKSRRASRTYTTSDFDGNTHAYRSAANASKGKGKKRGRTGREGPFKAQSYSETIDVDGDDSADDPNESMMSGPGGLTPATAKSYKRNKTRYSSLVN